MQGKTYVSLSKPPDCLWPTLSLLFTGYQDTFHGAKATGGLNFTTTHIHTHKHTQPPSNWKVDNERRATCNCSCDFVASTKTTALLYVCLLSVLLTYGHSDTVVYDSEIVGSNPFRGINMYSYLRFCAALWNYK